MLLATLTKGDLGAATKSLAIEYASRGIRANAVSLGVIQTALNPPGAYAALAKLHPVGHVGQVSDVVAGILYLESAGPARHSADAARSGDLATVRDPDGLLVLLAPVRLPGARDELTAALGPSARTSSQSAWRT